MALSRYDTADAPLPLPPNSFIQLEGASFGVTTLTLVAIVRDFSNRYNTVSITVTTAATGVIIANNVQLPYGDLISVQVFGGTLALSNMTNWARVTLWTAAISVGLPYSTVVCGQCTPNSALTWPGAEAKNGGEVDPAPRENFATTFGAGQNVSIALGNRAVKEVMLIGFQLTTDANVAVRTANLVLTFSNGHSMRIVPSGTQAQGVTTKYNWAPWNVAPTAFATDINTLTVPMMLPAGSVISTSITGIQVGDIVSAFTVIGMSVIDV